MTKAVESRRVESGRKAAGAPNENRWNRHSAIAGQGRARLPSARCGGGCLQPVRQPAVPRSRDLHASGLRSRGSDRRRPHAPVHHACARNRTTEPEHARRDPASAAGPRQPAARFDGNSAIASPGGVVAEGRKPGNPRFRYRSHDSRKPCRGCLAGRSLAADLHRGRFPSSLLDRRPRGCRCSGDVDPGVGEPAAHPTGNGAGHGEPCLGPQLDAGGDRPGRFGARAGDDLADRRPRPGKKIVGGGAAGHRAIRRQPLHGRRAIPPLVRAIGGAWPGRAAGHRGEDFDRVDHRRVYRRRPSAPAGGRADCRLGTADGCPSCPFAPLDRAAVGAGGAAGPHAPARPQRPSRAQPGRSESAGRAADAVRRHSRGSSGRGACGYRAQRVG